MIEPDFLKSDPLYTVKEAAGLLGIGLPLLPLANDT